MVINKRASKMLKFVEVHFLRTYFVEVLLVGMVFVVSIISSHIISESPIILPTHLPFLQLNFARIPNITFFVELLHSHQHLLLFHF